MSHAGYRILELTEKIQENVAILKERSSLLQTDLPSLDDGISEALQLDPISSKARQAIADHTAELQMTVRGPESLIMAPPHNETVSIHIITQYNIASKIPTDKDEGKTFAELAEACGLGEDIVKRVMRHACARFIFREEPKGIIRHNAASRTLAQSPLLQQWIGMVMNELWPCATRLSEALQKWPGSEEPNNAASNLVMSTELPVFQFWSTHPDRAKRFADGMSWFAKTPAFNIQHLVDNHDFEKHGDGTLVDVGGSHGIAALAVLQSHPKMKAIVQDLPEVAGQGQKSLLQIEGRLTFMAHDFFTEQPVRGAAVYLLRNILHDWSDKYATKILKALVPALTKESIILIMDQILPEPGAVSHSQELSVRSFDLAMLALSNGKERDKEDWENLLMKVDKRLVIVKTTKPLGSAMSLLEIRLRMA